MILDGTTPDGLHVDGWLNLSDCTGLTSLPNGLRVDRWLDLRGCSGLTRLPDGLRVDGWLDLTGCTGLTSMPDLSNVGDRVWLPDHLCTGNVRNIDGQTTVLGRWRAIGDARVAPARWFGGGQYKCPRIYVAQVGAHMAHGVSIEAAIDDARLKAIEATDRAELLDAVRASGVVTFGQFRALTGACSLGLRAGLRARGYDPETTSLPVETVREIGAGNQFVDGFLAELDG